MIVYRITKSNSGIVVGTDEEAILVCKNLKVARRAIADAHCLETQSAKRVSDHAVQAEDERI
jgi:hypothetical protein